MRDQAIPDVMAPVSEAMVLRGEKVYVVVGKEMVPSRDAFVSTACIVAICST